MICNLFLMRIVLLFIFFICFSQQHFAQISSRKSKQASQLYKEKIKIQSDISTPILVQDIQISGLKKIDSKLVLDKITQKKGEILDPSKIRQDIVQIFKTGYFENVQVELTSEDVLIYVVVEKPAVVEIKFEGNSEIKSDDLKDVVQLKPFEIFDPAKIQTAKEKIEKFYEGKGFLLAKITPKIETIIPGETVKVVFNIQEGEKVKVKKIKFLGNNKLSDDFLKSKLSTNEQGFFHMISGSGSFKQEAYERDWQILRFIYLNEGFMQVKIDRPQVYVTPDKRYIYITYRIDEGERYKIGEIDFAGDLLFSRNDLLSIIEITQKEYFSYEVLQKDLIALQTKYGDLGYAYTNVIPRTRINEKDRIVDITFEFDKGSKVYFGKITVTGNSKTRDRVIRRELRILEGELYNETNKRRSLENVQRLGFFDDLQFKTSSDVEEADKMNVEINVKERNTGTLQLSAGYGTVAGLTIQGSINQINFLGKGQRLGASLNSSRIGAIYNLSFTEPNYDDSDYLLGFDLYRSAIDRFEYRENREGGGGRIGRQFSDYLIGSIRYELTNVNLLPYYDQNNNVTTDLTIFPLAESSGWQSSITGSLEYDQRDDRFLPSKGKYLLGSMEYAGLGGDLKFTKTTASFRYFKKIFWEVIWRNNITHGYLISHGAREVPVNQRYLLGGPYSLRGYRFFRVGQRRFSQSLYNKYKLPPYSFPDEQALNLATVPVGGRQQLLLQTELEFPLIKEAGIRGVVFFDLGQAEDYIELEHFYSNVGFGFRWFSPIGPLRFEWGFPLRYNPLSPERFVFEFSIGAPF